MWKLEGYDKTTEELECEHLLPKLDSSEVRNILQIFDDEPIEPFMFEVNNSATLNTLLKFSERSIVIKPNLSYFLGFS